MKKFSLLILTLFLIALPVFADGETEDEIQLDLASPIERINLKSPQNLKSEKLDLTQQKTYTVTTQNIFDYKNKNPYDKHSTSFTREKKHGNFSFGTKSDYTFAPDSYSQTGTMFAKYNKNKFTLNTSYKSSAFTSLEKTGKGTFAFTPEYKLNNHVTLQNVYSTNFMDRNRKNELIFNLKPFKDDRMNFDIGAGQIYSETTTPVRSQLNFSTKFKF